jgi:hypothetical protein
MTLNDLLTTKSDIDKKHESVIISINNSGLPRAERRTMIKKANDIYWQNCLNLKSTIKSEADTN